MTYQKRIGNMGETIAAEFLANKGYQLIDHHYHTRYGELDLVMMELDSVVFVEVKTRTSDSFGTPEESVTPEKLERLQNAALLWLQAHPEVDDDWRMDVVSVKLTHDLRVENIEHFINVEL